MKTLLDIVRERPIDERPSHAARCPFCQGRRLSCHGTSTTLVGGGDGSLDGDPNHRHEMYHCKDCGKGFQRETKSGNVWYTTEIGGVLRGMPSCFERYVYTCASCQGDVTRVYTGKDGESNIGSLSYSTVAPGQSPVTNFRVFWVCLTCDIKEETEREYWRP